MTGHWVCLKEVGAAIIQELNHQLLEDKIIEYFLSLSFLSYTSLSLIVYIMFLGYFQTISPLSITFF